MFPLTPDAQTAAAKWLRSFIWKWMLSNIPSQSIAKWLRNFILKWNLSNIPW